MLRKFLVFALPMGLSLTAFAQEEKTTATEEQKPTTKISGFADVYYRYDFNKKILENNFTSFTESHNSFELGMASVKIEHSMGKVGVVADLGFGKRAADFSYNDDGLLEAVKQLYITYAPASWAKFTAGSWATHVGYELVDPQLNRNYSMAYMFTNGPFFHTGVKVDFTAGKHGFMVGIANPTDYKAIPDDELNRKKTVLAQYSFAPNDKLKAYLNFVGGQALDSTKSNQIDLVVTDKFSDKFSLGFNGTVNGSKFREDGKYGDSKSWWGSALYLNFDPKSWFGLCIRGEYFSDEKQLKIASPEPEGANIFAATISANFKVNSFIFIPEIRMDNASKKIFMDSDGASKSNATNFLIAAIYSF